MKPKAVAPLSVKTIRSYSDRKKLESVFKEHKVSIEDRIKLLTKAMGNPAISYTCGFPSTKERYEVIITSFIDGIWKPSFATIKINGEIR
jgi:hypothetical protein